MTKKSLTTIIFVLGLLLLGTVSFFAAQKASPTCFTVADYQAFYGTDPEDGTRDPKDSFFTTSYQYLPDSLTIDTSESYRPEPDAAKIAKLLRNNKAKPVIITLSVTYDQAGDNTVLAEKRIASLKDILVAAGISPDVIHGNMTPYSPDDEDSEVPDTDSVTLTLASAQDCRV